MLLLLCLTLLTAAQGSASKVSGSGSTEVEFGGEAHFECTVDPAKGVRQVTWQRSFKDESIENLATFSSRFGQEVNAAYQGKVEFTRAALNSTSIRLRSVSWEDESCYICLFNMYPDGSKRKHTCLTVTGVSSVNTSTALLQEEEEELHAFSCSATGKPAPSIHWELPPDAAVDNQTETTTSRNSDGTFTSSRSVTLRAPPLWSGMVDCVLNQGTSGERRRRIRSGNLEEITKESSGSVSRSHLVVIATASCLALCLGAVAAAAALRCKSRSKMATPMAEEV